MKLTSLKKLLPKTLIVFLSASFLAGCSGGSNPTPVQPNPTPAKTATVSLFAGSGAVGSANGLGAAASFNSPQGITTDLYGVVYIADFGNYLVRKITPEGAVTTFAGNGSKGIVTGTAALSTPFNSPNAITVDPYGNVFITDQNNLQIDEITQAGAVSVFAGSGKAGSANGLGTVASFTSLGGITSDQNGTLYVTDGSSIRKILQSGAVSTFATGNFTQPAGIVADFNGNVYVADAGHNLILKFNSKGGVSTFAGSGQMGSTNGNGTAASFNSPEGLAIDVSGNIYVADTNNKLIRMINIDGAVTTLAGGASGGSALNGTGANASFSSPTGITVDLYGNIYVTDTNNELIRKIVVK